MTPEARAVIDAVLAALDIPYAATDGGDETRAEVLDKRLMHTVVCLRQLTRSAAPSVPHSLAYLRERLAEHPPVGYVTKDQAHEAIARGASWLEAVAAAADAEVRS
jgi:hypothetical protein